MPTFVANETEDEEILFAAWGMVKKNQDAKKSLLIKEGKNLTNLKDGSSTKSGLARGGRMD